MKILHEIIICWLKNGEVEKIYFFEKSTFFGGGGGDSLWSAIKQL